MVAVAQEQLKISNILLVSLQGSNDLQELPSWIRNLGYQVYTATTPAQTVAQIHSEQIDLVLVHAPAEESVTITRQIKDACEEFQWIPVIYIDENEEAQTILDIVDQGIDDYLVSGEMQAMLPAKLKATGRIAASHQHLTNQICELGASIEKLKHISTYDALTGVPNRRQFDEQLVTEWRRSRRDGTALAMFMIDVDYFKQYNDYYGHIDGDTCLKKIAQAIATSIRRPADFLARYGGEEFAVILPKTDMKGAIIVADKVLQCIREMKMPHTNSSVSPYVSVSIGVGSIEKIHDGLSEYLLKAADEAMYQAKDAGRNTYRELKLVV